MKRTKRIENILKKNIPDFGINVVDNSNFHKGHGDFSGEGETHLMVNIKKNNLSNLSSLKIHRKINTLLKDEFTNGLHSLQIKII